MKNIIAILNETDKENGTATTKAFAEGIHVAGQRYVATRVEDRHVYGRQVRPPLFTMFPAPFSLIPEKEAAR